MVFLAAAIYVAGAVAECGPTVSPETTQALIQVESGGDPLAIGTTRTRKLRAQKPGKAEMLTFMFDALVPHISFIDAGHAEK